MVRLDDPVFDISCSVAEVNKASAPPHSDFVLVAVYNEDDFLRYGVIDGVVLALPALLLLVVVSAYNLLEVALLLL